MAKFKVGDKVKIPKTKSYYSDTFDEFKEEIKDYSEKYLIVKSVENNYYKLNRIDEKFLFYCSFAESDLELYEENIGNTPPQFEIGEWYKAVSKNSNDIYYTKCQKVETCAIEGGYLSLSTKKWWGVGRFSFDAYTFEKVDKNIKEIQDYLPDNHEDKQQPNLVKGKYYSFDYYGDFYWFRFEKLENDVIYSSAYRYNNAYSKWEERITNLVGLKDAKNLKEVTEQEAKGIENTSLVGRWIKTLKANINISDCLENTYYKVEEEVEGSIKIKVKEKYSLMYISKQLENKDWILMPVDFNPEQENKEWIPKVGEWAYILGTGHTENNEHFPKGAVFQIESVKKGDKNSYYIYVNKKNNPCKITGSCTNSKDCRKALPYEIPNSENIQIVNHDLSEYRITYNSEVFPEKSPKNEEIVVKTAKKPKILVNIQVKNVKIPEIKIPIKVVPKKANRIIIKNFNLTI